MFGDSDSDEEFYGFEDKSISDEEAVDAAQTETDEETTYTVYRIIPIPYNEDEEFPYDVDSGLGKND